MFLCRFGVVGIAKKVLIATEKPFSADARGRAEEILTKEGFEVLFLEKYTEKSQLAEAVRNCNALIVRSDEVDAEVIDAAKGLELVVRAGAGYNTIDLEACGARDIYVMNTPDANAQSVAELAFFLAGANLRGIYTGHTNLISTGKESAFTGKELHEKKLGILGFGAIGQRAAVLAGDEEHGLGMKVYAYDPDLAKKRIADQLGVKMVNSPEELYDGAFMISAHVPLNQHTAGIVTYNLLSLMKPDGILVNTARPAVINYPDLEKILQEREKFRFSTDFGDQEEVLRWLGDPALAPRILATTHFGASTPEANYRAAESAASQVVAFLVRGDDPSVVNKGFVVPKDLRGFADLAYRLGVLSRALMDESPITGIKSICYGALEPYGKPITRHLLKGIFAAKHGSVLPNEAESLAAQYGIRLEMEAPKKDKAYGNSITVDVVSENIAHSIRGTVYNNAPMIMKVNEDYQHVNFVPRGYVALFTYADRPGVIAKLSNAFSMEGYNLSSAVAVQSVDTRTALALFQAENGTLENLHHLVAGIKRSDSTISRAVAVDFGPLPKKA